MSVFRFSPDVDPWTIVFEIGLVDINISYQKYVYFSRALLGVPWDGRLEKKIVITDLTFVKYNRVH
jgi:hypothetical protein